ncbi:MAG: lipopolysaccharide transport periplasmic protein LptA [bacterium]
MDEISLKRKCKNILFFISFCIGIFYNVSLAQNQDFIDINANVMEMQDDKKLIIFTGDVVAKKQNVNLYCEKLNVYYTEDTKTKKRDVDYMIAEGKVKIVQFDKVATGDTAKYFKNEDLIVLEGKPAIIREGNDNEIRGNKVTFYVKENKSIVEGNRPKVIFRLGD